MKRPNKFRNKPCVIDGIRFASMKEGKRYGELNLLQRAGQISGLVCQPRYPLIVNGAKFGEYRGDFAFAENGKAVCEDVKSKPTKTPLYRLKIKLAALLYPNTEFREVN